MKTIPQTESAPSHLAGHHVVESHGGSLRFTVHRVHAGLCVKRELERPAFGKAIQVAVFETPADFRQWCESDRLRFDSPVAHRELLRVAESCFGHDDDLARLA